MPSSELRCTLLCGNFACFLPHYHMFFTIFITVLPVFGIMLLGFLSQRGRFLSAEMATCLNQFVYWIALPALLFHELANMRTGDLPGAFVGALFGGAGLALGLAFLLFLWPGRLPGSKAGMSALFATFPNSAFVGLPMLALLWPDNSFALLSGSISTVVYTVLLVGADVGIQAATGSHKDGVRHFLRETGRSLWCNPLLVSTVVGALWNVLALPVPDPLKAVTGMLRATAAPCALFCMGMLLEGQMDLIRQRGGRTKKRAWLPQAMVLGIKLVLQPLLVWAILAPLGLSAVIVGTSVLQASMPTGLASYVVAEKYGIDAETAPLVIMISTALSIFTVPAVASLLRVYGLV